MKRIRFLTGIFTVFALALTFASCGGKNSNGWYTDFEAAKKAAKSRNKDIVLFVNSVYDAPETSDGVNLLIGTPEFTKAVSEDFVCVHFDFSKIPEVMGQNPASLTGSEQKALEKKQKAMTEQFSYANIYGVRGTPELSMITKEGFYVTSVNFDYLNTSVSGYKDLLYMEIGPLQDFKALLASARKGSLESRMDSYDSILKSADEIRRRCFRPLWKEAVSLDRNNVSGLLGEFVIESAHLDATSIMLEKRDFAASSKVYENAAANEKITDEERQELLFFAAEPYRVSVPVNYGEITRLLNAAIEAAPEGKFADGIRTRLSEVEADREQHEASASDYMDEK